VYTIRRTEDVDEVRDLHTLTFPGDEWVGDGREYWIVQQDGRAVGFAVATYIPETNCVSLDRAGVIPGANGQGLQRRLIHARLRWAKRLGACVAITYVALRNYQSIVNLLKCGFHFYTPERKPGAYEDEDGFHFLRLNF
jgi:GNAT superfamily N-acetyltransferase